MSESFHPQFLAALSGDEAALSPWCAGTSAQAGLSVYRNTSAKGCADALGAQFPTVERVVGPSWLSAAAVAHASAHPPQKASLLGYGAAFSDWLTTFPPAAGMPFLSDLAGLDWLWTLAHLAVDAEPLDATQVAQLSPDAFAEHALVVHPAAHWAGFETTVPSLWRALQPPGNAPAAFELEVCPEGLLFVRPGLEVGNHLIGRGELAFLDACRDGAPMAAAALAALTAEPELDLATAFARLVNAGAFSELRSLI